MAKIDFKPGNMLYPLPAVLVTVADKQGKSNIFTVAWAGTVCTNPPMVSISVRKERFSHAMLLETGEFVINLTTEKLAYATDYCGVRSGRDVNKCKELDLHLLPGKKVKVPRLLESPVNIECRVTEVKELGSHDMFIADVVNVRADERNLNPETGKLELAETNPLVYVHGGYYELGEKIGKFGWSVEKKKN